ncbi:uncharacterized protein LOC126998324 [Eriocheir sinensis]|uniref:uncharacterized protein LOC126998324 n=1 Tax=Eriocheir sinensis TaxID=95602 RepID=UPI0021C81F19|nr:uncharacterized protein LOC126998324 [Eriocheir sinensis]
MAAGPARCSARSLRRCARRRARVVKALIIAAVLGGFLYHTSLNLRRHLKGKTLFITSEETSPPAPFPTYRLCIWPTWNPRRLVSLGLKLSNLSHREILKNYYQLTGIPEHMTGRQLVEKAAWRVEDLVEEVRVGNIHEEYYSTAPFTSNLWRRSFTPVGPCITLTPPPSASFYAQTLSIKLREKPADIQACRWVEEGRVRIYEGPEDCPSVTQYCNTSCEWEEFITNFFFNRLHYLLSTSHSISISGTGNALAHSVIKNVVVEPFKVIPLKENGPVDAEDCYFKCVMAPGEKENNCTGLRQTSLDDSLSNLCVKYLQLFSVSKNFITEYLLSHRCINSCKFTSKETKWRQLEKTFYPNDTTFKIRLLRPVTVVMTEIEMYPLSLFLTDTGGGLGLFLGVCALDVWNFLVRVVVSREVVARRPAGRTLGHLGQLVGALVVSMGTCVHLLIMGKSYLQQPVTLSASLGASDASHATPFVTLESLLVERMASRVLGCRASSTPKQNECVKCVLQGETGQSLPFISVDDLPRCTAEHLTFPRLAFTVPKLHIEGIARKETTASCSACDHLNDSRPPDFVQYSVDENSPYSPNSMLCTLGGLMGLYLGLSLLNVQDLFQRTLRKLHRDAGGRCRGVAWVGFTGGVVAVAVAICFLQLGTFFGAHPVYSSTSTHSLQEGVLPSITTCVWPPFNIRRLLETAGLGAAFANLSLITNPEARDAASALLLQDLPETSNVTDPHILWDAGAWAREELMIGYTIMYRDLERIILRDQQTSNGILNHCWKYTPNISRSSWSRNTLFIQGTHPYPEHLELYDYFLSYLHYPDEDLLIQPNMLSNLVTFQSFDISSVTKWRSLDENRVGGRAGCVSRCLEAALATHLGCRLPFDVSSQNFDSCSMTVFAGFLTNVWRLRTRPWDAFQNIVGQDLVSRCYTACRYGDQIFIRLKHNTGVEDMVMPGLSVAFPKQNKSLLTTYRMSSGTLEHMSVRDGYAPTTLVSDLGGIVGMTLGVSLLSLFLTLVTKMTRSRRTLTKVSSQLPAQ